MLLTAAALLVLLGIAHSYLGERYILIRLLRRTDLPKLFGADRLTKHTLRFAWHLTTIAWFGFAGLLVLLAYPGGDATSGRAHVISATFAASGLLALVGSRGRHLSWIGFFLIAGLTWLAFA